MFNNHLPGRSRGKYSPIFTEPEENNCYSIITQVNIRETEKKTNFCTSLPTTSKEKHWKVLSLELYSTRGKPISARESLYLPV
jgi:hypothetical protein